MYNTIPKIGRIRARQNPANQNRPFFTSLRINMANFIQQPQTATKLFRDSRGAQSLFGWAPIAGKAAKGMSLVQNHAQD